MTILIALGFNDSLVDCLVRPITQLGNVQEVLLVRNWPGPNLPKVRYYCPPQFISRFPILATFYKLFILIYLSLVEKPDFIHSFRLFPHGIMAFITAKLTRRPIGVTLNAGPVELYRIGGSPLGISFSQPLPWRGKVYLWMLKHSDVVAVINSFANEFLISHGINEDKIYVLPQPVNKDKCYPRQIPKKYDVISLGLLVPVKHVEVLLKATAKVKEKYPDIKVGIVGDGPSKTFLEKLASELAIGANVEFLGLREDVAYYYNSAKIFILTSEREGGPLTFTEAMACAIPPIASKCGIVADIGRDSVNCIIIEDYNDSNAFAMAIIRLLEDNELYHKLSQNALQTARNITVEDAMQVWENVLEQCSMLKTPGKPQS